MLTKMLTKMLKKDASTFLDGQLASELVNLLILSVDREMWRNLSAENALEANSISIILVSSSLFFFYLSPFFSYFSSSSFVTCILCIDDAFACLC